MRPTGGAFSAFARRRRSTGERVSTIVDAFPRGTRVTTPRHHVQWVVTEHGAVDLSVLDDAERPRALIALADPQFRDALSRAIV